MGDLKKTPSTRMTLKAARILAGYNQTQAGKLIGVSADTIANYEKGKSYPDVPTLKRIEDVYGVRYDDLIFLPSNFGKTEV